MNDYRLDGGVDFNTINKTYDVVVEVTGVKTLDEAKQLLGFLSSQFRDYLVAHGGGVISMSSSNPDTQVVKPNIILPGT